jgi:hypothetical protein
MACTINLFEQLGGTPETGGNWFATSGPFPFTLNFGTCPSAGTPLNIPAAHTQIGVGHNICIDLTGAPQGPYVFTYVKPEDRTSESCSFDCVGCTTVTINTTPPPEDGEAEFCSNVADCINLYNLLGNTPSTNGNWESLNAPWPQGQSNDNNGANDCFRPIDFGVGSFEFKYTINSDVPCDNCSGFVVVNLTPALNPGETNEIDICEGNCPVNLFANLGGTPDPGGNWFFASPGPITVDVGNCPDTDNIYNLVADGPVGVGHDICVDFFGVAPGTYRFTYVVVPTADRDSCNIECIGCADLIINIMAAPEDGEPLEICEDEGNIYLYNLLGNTPSTNGNWACTSGCGGEDWGVGYSPDNNGANDFVSPSAIGPGDYTFTYTLNSDVPCDTCTAEVRVIILEGPTGGESATVKVCN